MHQRVCGRWIATSIYDLKNRLTDSHLYKRRVIMRTETRLNGQRGKKVTDISSRPVPSGATLTFIFPSQSLIKLHAKSFFYKA